MSNMSFLTPLHMMGYLLQQVNLLIHTSQLSSKLMRNILLREICYMSTFPPNSLGMLIKRNGNLASKVIPAGGWFIYLLMQEISFMLVWCFPTPKTYEVLMTFNGLMGFSIHLLGKLVLLEDFFKMIKNGS